jgi:hypothetical protein
MVYPVWRSRQTVKAFFMFKVLCGSTVRYTRSLISYTLIPKVRYFLRRFSQNSQMPKSIVSGPVLSHFFRIRTITVPRKGKRLCTPISLRSGFHWAHFRALYIQLLYFPYRILSTSEEKCRKQGTISLTLLRWSADFTTTFMKQTVDDITRRLLCA